MASEQLSSEDVLLPFGLRQPDYLYLELGPRAPLEGNVLSKTRAGAGASWQVFQ